MMRSTAMLVMPSRIFEPYGGGPGIISFGIRCPITYGMLCSALAMRSISQGLVRFGGPMLVHRMDRGTKMAIAILVTLIVFVIILATYGWLSGAWDANG